MPDPCRCYVAALDYLTRFGLRRGAHTRCCPMFRESLDPVDRRQDQETKMHHLKRLDLANRTYIRGG